MPTTCIPSRPAERDEYTWLEEGDQLFLLMDVNEDIRTGGTSKMNLELDYAKYYSRNMAIMHPQPIAEDAYQSTGHSLWHC